MARFKIQELEVTELESSEKGRTFVATGTLRDLVSKTKSKPFVAKTVIWKGEPIFKVQESGALLSLKKSQFTRGERIQIARSCKAARLDSFGEGHKAAVEPELESGETVTIAASVEADAESASDEELTAASEMLRKIAELDAQAAA